MACTLALTISCCCCCCWCCRRRRRRRGEIELGVAKPGIKPGAKPGARPKAEKVQQQKAATGGDEEDKGDYEPLDLQSMDYEHMYTHCGVGVAEGRGNKKWEWEQQDGSDYTSIATRQLDKPNTYTSIQLATTV